MPAGNCNLTIEQGATWSQSIQYQTANGTNISLSGYTIRMQARPAYTANTTLDLSTTNGNITITSAANGTFTFQQTAAQTANLTAGSYVYDLELVKPDTTVDRLLYGTLTVTPEVTR
jgi:hypothetical protein